MTISVNRTSSQKSRKKKSGNTEEHISYLNNLIIFFMVLIPIAAFFCAMIIYVRMNSEVEKINKKVTQMQAEIHSYQRQMENYRMQIEQGSGKNILFKIKKYGLNLDYPKAGQVHKLSFPKEPKLLVETTLQKNKIQQ